VRPVTCPATPLPRNNKTPADRRNNARNIVAVDIIEVVEEIKSEISSMSQGCGIGEEKMVA
jgi:hypothetical protein